MAKTKKYAATDENLLEHALAPTMRKLIAVALDGTTATYGDIKEMLQRDADFSTIFATRIGMVAGSLMDRIQKIEPDAPLINVLVVNQKDRQPSKGAGGYMGTRFEEARLFEEKAKKKYPKLWKTSFDAAAQEVYQLGENEWSELYCRVFGKELPATKIEQDRDERQKGTEQDGLRMGRAYGKGGEGPFHKSLRLWVKDNPQEIRRSFAGAATETESNLDSGDRIDALYRCDDRIVVLEVKSRISNEIDMKRGVYQCIKYRAVRQAMDVRDKPLIEAYLVTETPISGEIAALLKLHKIKHYQAPQDRK